MIKILTQTFISLTLLTRTQSTITPKVGTIKDTKYTKDSKIRYKASSLFKTTQAKNPFYKGSKAIKVLNLTTEIDIQNSNLKNITISKKLKNEKTASIFNNQTLVVTKTDYIGEKFDKDFDLKIPLFEDTETTKECHDLVQLANLDQLAVLCIETNEKELTISTIKILLIDLKEKKILSEEMYEEKDVPGWKPQRLKLTKIQNSKIDNNKYLIAYDFGAYRRQILNSETDKPLPTFVCYVSKLNSENFEKVQKSVTETSKIILELHSYPYAAFSMIEPENNNSTLTEAEFLLSEKKFIFNPEFTFSSSTKKALFFIRFQNKTVIEFESGTSSIKRCFFNSTHIKEFGDNEWIKTCDSIIDTLDIPDSFVYDIQFSLKGMVVQFIDQISLQFNGFFVSSFSKFGKFLKNGNFAAVIQDDFYQVYGDEDMKIFPVLDSLFELDVSKIESSEDKTTVTGYDDEDTDGKTIDLKIEKFDILDSSKSVIYPFQDFILPNSAKINIGKYQIMSDGNIKHLSLDLLQSGKNDFELDSAGYYQNVEIEILRGFENIKFVNKGNICAYDGSDKLKIFTSCTHEQDTINCRSKNWKIINVGKYKLEKCFYYKLNKDSSGVLAFFQGNKKKIFGITNRMEIITSWRTWNMDKGIIYNVLENGDLISCDKIGKKCEFFEMSIGIFNRVTYRKLAEFDQNSMGLETEFCPVDIIRANDFYQVFLLFSKCSDSDQIVYSIDRIKLEILEKIKINQNWISVENINSDLLGITFSDGKSNAVRISALNKFTKFRYPMQELNISRLIGMENNGLFNKIFYGEVKDTEKYAVFLVDNKFHLMDDYLISYQIVEKFDDLEIFKQDKDSDESVILKIKRGSSYEFFKMGCRNLDAEIVHKSQDKGFKNVLLNFSMTVINDQVFSNTSSILSFDHKELGFNISLKKKEKLPLKNATYNLNDLFNMEGSVESIILTPDPKYINQITQNPRISTFKKISSPPQTCNWISVNNKMKLCLVFSGSQIMYYFNLNKNNIWKSYIEEIGDFDTGVQEVKLISTNTYNIVYSISQKNKESEYKIYLKFFNNKLEFLKNFNTSIESAKILPPTMVFEGYNNKLKILSKSMRYLSTVDLNSSPIELTTVALKGIPATHYPCSYFKEDYFIHILFYVQRTNQLNFYHYNLQKNQIEDEWHSLKRKYKTEIKNLECKSFDQPKDEFIGHCIFEQSDQANVHIHSKIPLDFNKELNENHLFIKEKGNENYKPLGENSLRLGDDYILELYQKTGSSSRMKALIWKINENWNPYTFVQYKFYDDSPTIGNKFSFFMENEDVILFKGIDLSDNHQFLKLKEAEFTVEEGVLGRLKGLDDLLLIEFYQNGVVYEEIRMNEVFKMPENPKPSGGGNEGYEGDGLAFLMVGFFFVIMGIVFVYFKKESKKKLRYKEAYGSFLE